MSFIKSIIKPVYGLCINREVENYRDPTVSDKQMIQPHLIVKKGVSGLG